MKLLIILLCLISERYLPHISSQYRFHWFSAYYARINESFDKAPAFLKILFVLVPVLVILGLILSLLGSLLFGIIGFIISLLLFYYCLGPENPFYPMQEEDDSNPNARAESYFVAANSQLFAPIFWFVLFGPLVLVAYRLLTLLVKQEETAELAETIVGYLDWVTIRITLMLYFLAGNFQKGFQFFSTQWLSPIENNNKILGQAGLLSAIEQEEPPAISLMQAQELVERALIIFLVFIAIFTLAAWL